MAMVMRLLVMLLVVMKLLVMVPMTMVLKVMMLMLMLTRRNEIHNFSFVCFFLFCEGLTLFFSLPSFLLFFFFFFFCKGR